MKGLPIKMYKDESLKKYLDDLSAKLPAPGGGSSAGFCAAMGAALLSMVINFTLGKPKYAKFEKDLKHLLEKSEKLRTEFLRLTDLDVVAYQSKNRRDSLNTPFMLARLCFEGIKLCPELIKKGNINLISDVAVAAILLESAFTSAYFNVEINLQTIGNKKLARGIRNELAQKAKLVAKIRLNTEENVGKIIRG